MFAELEQHLREATVLHGFQLPVVGGAHPEKMGLVLAGGVGVLAKPNPTGDANLDRAIKAEVAAWETAKLFGWTDLVATTVLREVPHPNGEMMPAAVQVFWLQSTPDEQPIDCFSYLDTFRAGIFDVVIKQPDRSHNWLGVAGDAAGAARRLKLVDHAYAFGVQDGFSSVFYDRHQGQPLPEDHKGALQAVADCAATELATLLGAEATNVETRAATLLAAGVLQQR